MELKKNPGADLQKKYWFFLGIASLVTMSLMLFAFEYKVYEESVAEQTQRRVDAFEETIEVPPTEIQPPPPPQVQAPVIVEVPDEEEIQEDINLNLNVEVTQDTKVEEVVVKPVEEPKEEVDEIFTIVEESAAPKGGMSAFYKYVGEKLKYPPQARRMTIEGRVFVEFVVNKDGSISDVRAVKGIGGGCDEEAVRVLQASPPWTPGKQRGKPVKQKMVLPITFKLN